MAGLIAAMLPSHLPLKSFSENDKITTLQLGVAHIFSLVLGKYNVTVWFKTGLITF